MKSNFLLVTLFVLGITSTVTAQKCLKYGPTVSFEGTLQTWSVLEPPNDFMTHATVLILKRKICTTGNVPPDISERSVRNIQLVITRAADWKTVRSLMGKEVTVSGRLFHAHTGHHHTKVLIDVSMIKPGSLDIGVATTYPAVWFAPINDPNKPSWEILPKEAKAGEVILSKRNELGILSNFAATPFELYGTRYASVEGFWQMMLYPEGTSDERRVTRGKDGKAVVWKYTREQVAQMTAFEAKSAGTLAEENMKTLGIDWVTFDGKRFPYRSATPGEHYKLILAAMRAKANQNPEVKRILLATGDLILKPDHHGEENPPPEWKYYEVWMQLRSELQKNN